MKTDLVQAQPRSPVVQGIERERDRRVDAAAGRVLSVKRCPTSGTKSFGISHAASASLEVSAAHTRSIGCR
jgi:hypothetical protein